jgi:hypothetical protein
VVLPHPLGPIKAQNSPRQEKSKKVIPFLKGARRRQAWLTSIDEAVHIFEDGFGLLGCSVLDGDRHILPRKTVDRGVLELRLGRRLSLDVNAREPFDILHGCHGVPFWKMGIDGRKGSVSPEAQSLADLRIPGVSKSLATFEDGCHGLFGRHRYYSIGILGALEG